MLGKPHYFLKYYKSSNFLKETIFEDSNFFDKNAKKNKNCQKAKKSETPTILT